MGCHGIDYSDRRYANEEETFYLDVATMVVDLAIPLPPIYTAVKGSSVAARGAASAAERGVSVLGHYPGYVNTAETIGARYFNVPSHVWARMSSAEQWAANTRFLDRLIARGDTVLLSTPASQARAGSWFARELEYLSSRGYSLSADGTRMLPLVQ